uniref:Heat shock protein n=1 Tax=Spodoptera frugiperda TaxID=7108 RepID=A0A7G9U6H5_SPOFR|nr:heat shock protein [Spodoptera frugiperda]
MFLRTLLGSQLQSKLCYSMKNNRSLRPTVRIGKDSFHLSINVNNYNKDEIRVKAHPEYVVIEGKQEKETEQGYALRQFIRKFKLPEGCIPSQITCRLSPDGTLKIEVPRTYKDAATPAEVFNVPICYGSFVTDKEEIDAKKCDDETKNTTNCTGFAKVKCKPRKPKSPPDGDE